MSFIVSAQAKTEVRFLRAPPGPDDEDDGPALEPVQLYRLVSAGRLEVRALDEAHADAFAACAARLRDADASCVALAAIAGLGLATDDSKVRRVARELHPELPLFTTLQLVREATGRMRLDGAELHALLRDLRLRGNFAPPRQDPERAWYEALLRDGDGPTQG
jgi:predicted nucleic acid-binding protein